MINQAKTLHDQLEQIGGCGDGSCIVHIRPGMHTNGGCRCNREPYKMSRVIHWHKRAVAEQAQQIERLRAEIGEWRSAACTNAELPWPHFEEWDTSQLARCFVKYVGEPRKDDVE